jgi:hypothetical protein
LCWYGQSDRPDKYDNQQNSDYPFLPHLTFSLLPMEVFGFDTRKHTMFVHAVMNRSGSDRPSVFDAFDNASRQAASSTPVMQLPSAGGTLAFVRPVFRPPTRSPGKLRPRMNISTFVATRWSFFIFSHESTLTVVTPTLRHLFFDVTFESGNENHAKDHEFQDITNRAKDRKNGQRSLQKRPDFNIFFSSLVLFVSFVVGILRIKYQ